MVVGFLVRRRLPFQKRDVAKEKLYWVNNSGKALLQSSVNDADLVTDWIYFCQVAAGEDADLIPRWLRAVQLASCVSGSFSWLVIASDGRVLDWLRRAIMWPVVGILSALVFAFFTLPRELLSCLRRNRIGGYHNVFGSESCLEDCEWPLQSGIVRVRSSFETGFRFASGAVLFLGILMEDVPQIAVTFLIEDVIRSDEAMGTIGNASGAAQISLVFAIFDICHKLAEAYDLRNDVVKAGDAALHTLRGHKERVSALAAAGASRFVSGAEDGTWRLWDAAEGKAVGSSAKHPSSKHARTSDVVVLDNKRIVVTYEIVAHHRDQTVVSDMETGSMVKTLSHVAGSTMAAAVSPDSKSFVAACTNGVVRHWNASNLELVKEINSIIPKRSLHMSLAFLDDYTFAEGGRGHQYVWICTLDQQRFPLDNHGKVHSLAAMSPTSLLVGLGEMDGGFGSPSGVPGLDEGRTVKRWDVSRRKLMQIFEGHQGSVDALAKINETLFASGSSDKMAKIWSISSGQCLHTLAGHTRSVGAIAYLTGEKLIVTGSDDKSIKVWGIDVDALVGKQENAENESDSHVSGER